MASVVGIPWRLGKSIAPLLVLRGQQAARPIAVPGSAGPALAFDLAEVVAFDGVPSGEYWPVGADLVMPGPNRWAHLVGNDDDVEIGPMPLEFLHRRGYPLDANSGQLYSTQPCNRVIDRLDDPLVRFLDPYQKADDLGRFLRAAGGELERAGA